MVIWSQALRIWLTGSQGCEQMFRHLRSMTPIFSTIINFTLRGMLERIHKINYLSNMESDNEIQFPRAKRRLLHLNEESDATFAIPSVEEITSSLMEAKNEAINICRSCCMELENYEDTILLDDKMSIFDYALVDSEIEIHEEEISEEVVLTQDEVISIRKDMSRINLIKSKGKNLPTYEISFDVNNNEKCKKYPLMKDGKSSFLVYEGAVIRKNNCIVLITRKLAGIK